VNFETKLKAGAPKKLLALDGGGIRGIISLEILAAIEAAVQRPLCEYFDYIAGTSTGAIIASCLSLGMSVEEVRDFYRSSGPYMFSKAHLLQRFRHKFDDEALASQLREAFAEYSPDGSPPTLGSGALKTLLLLVLRNATTDSPWPLSNNPRAKYNEVGLVNCNLELPLWQLVRASTAAPAYFPPELVSVGNEEFLFVDGGVTMYNNPAFLLLMMATLPAYRVGWPAGPDKLLLVSVGTGASAEANRDLEPGQMNLLYHAASVPSALMYAAMVEQDKLCRVFGRCLHGDHLDSELDGLLWSAGKPPGLAELCSYVRYTADLSRKGLDALGLSEIDPKHVQALDSIEHIAALQRVGAEVAKRVKASHFAGFPG
jgi:uncharacterized protein